MTSTLGEIRALLRSPLPWGKRVGVSAVRETYTRSTRTDDTRTAMQVTVRLFAGLKERFGPQLEEGFEADAITIAVLCERLAQTRPDLAQHLPGLAVAINQEYVRDFETPIREGDEVALISPISGGSEADGTPHFLVTPDVLDARALRDLVRT